VKIGNFDPSPGAALAARLGWERMTGSEEQQVSATAAVLRWKGESVDTFRPKISQGNMLRLCSGGRERVWTPSDLRYHKVTCCGCAQVEGGECGHLPT
jgi:hypothetical protein